MKFMPRFMAMTLITVMAGAQAAQATADTDNHRPPQPPMHAMHGGPMEGGFMHDLARIKADLKLSPDQEAGWQAAEAASKAAHEAMRQQHEAARDQFKAEMQKDIIDLAKLDQLMSQQREQARSLHEAAKSKWLAVYASLSDDQKRLVSQRIKAKMARFDKMRERFQERHKAKQDAAPAKG